MLNKHNIFINAKIGFEFEFFSKDNNTNNIKKELSSLLNKKIKIFKIVHGDFVPTDKVFKIEQDFSGGQRTLELITGPMRYSDAIINLIKINKYITDNGETNDRCGLHINVSFDNKNLSKINILKYILDFDEKVVYKNFPNRINNVYTRSIKNIIPHNKYFLKDNIDLNNISPLNFILPATKYYGINFMKLINNYLEFRYLGGKNYNKKTDKIINVIEYIVKNLYEAIDNNKYTKENKIELQRIFDKFSKITEAYKSYDFFRTYFKNINFTVDLNNDYKVNKLYYINIKDKINNLLLSTNIKKGNINYDTKKGILQVANANFKCFDLNGLDIYNCTVEGLLNNCSILNSTVNNSILNQCNIYFSCTINDSKLLHNYITTGTKIIRSYIDGWNTMMSGMMEGGIFRKGYITQEAKIGKDVEIIEFKKTKI